MFEIFREDLKCNLYIDANEEISTLLQNIAELLNSSDVKSNTISIHEGDISLVKNKNFNMLNRKSPEDGFLFYCCILKINPTPALGEKNAIELTSKLLEWAWEMGYPAIATCNYESKLPNNGGYKSSNVPIPK